MSKHLSPVIMLYMVVRVEDDNGEEKVNLLSQHNNTKNISTDREESYKRDSLTHREDKN